MSIRDLESKMKSRERSICNNYFGWVINPERCKAAKNTLKKLNNFLKMCSKIHLKILKIMPNC